MLAKEASRPRRRFGLSRSKAGCTVCRQRHLKCDEAKPSCQRCTTGGWTCIYPLPSPDGYTNGRRARGSQTPSSSDEDGSGLSLIRPAVDIGLSTSERRALAYFTEYAAGEMYGYLVSDIWTYVIPQRCMSVPVIRNAVVGLSTMHWEFVSSPDSGSLSDMAEPSLESTKAYNKAISSLRQYIANSDAPAEADVLLVCLVLICCELLRGTPDQATKHLDMGAAIVKFWATGFRCSSSHAYDRSLQEQDDFNMLSRAFVAMEVHAVAFNDERMPILSGLDLPGDINSLESAQLPARFSAIRDAQYSLNQLLGTAFAAMIETAPYKISYTTHVPQAHIRRRELLRVMCDRWLSAMLELESELGVWSANPSVEDRKRQKTVAVLRAQHLSIQCLLDENIQINPCDEEHCASSFDDNAGHFIRWASIATDSDITPDDPAAGHAWDSGNGKRAFSIDLGLGPPLILFAFKTTNTAYQQRAISLLRRDKRLQGWYDLKHMTAIMHDLSTHPDAPEPWSENHYPGRLESTAAAAAKASADYEAAASGLATA
ncbi:hypothetical protein LTR86_010001 [Recurvomyces mirabilis]|nr:hypothetical protein LTR86_010001 [Recurvomyces mirabilis]